jgi:hypothetical protein
MVGTAMNSGGVDTGMDDGEQKDGNGDHAGKGLMSDKE